MNQGVDMHAWKQQWVVAMVLGLGAGASVALADQPSEVTAPVEKVFVPYGFDSNDNVELIVHGHFPSTCYKTGSATAVVDEARRVVTLDVKAYSYNALMCAQVMVPFSQTVKLGTVAPGTYRIEVADRPDAVTAPLVVGETQSSSPDDFLYASVAQVDLAASGNGQYQVTIAGEYPYFYVGCMVIREVRTYLSPGNTLVVMPVAEIVHGVECQAQTSKKFTVTKTVGGLEPAEYLVHVRVLNGESVNRFVDLTRN
jgi:hypothetical protein